MSNSGLRWADDDNSIRERQPDTGPDHAVTLFSNLFASSIPTLNEYCMRIFLEQLRGHIAETY